MIPTSSNALIKAITIDQVKKPISTVKLWDSPYGVPSYGMQMRVYNNASTVDGALWSDTNLVFVGQVPQLSFDWDDSAPPGLQQVDRFSVRFYGYFYAEYTGRYTFLANAAGSVRLYMGNNSNRAYHPSGLQTTHRMYMPPIQTGLTVEDSWSHHGHITTYSGGIDLTAGQWYPLRVEYQNLEGKAAVSVQYIEPPNINSAVSNMWGETFTRSTDQFKKVLSAGAVNYTVLSGWSRATDTNVNFIQPLTLDRIIEIQGSKRAEQAAQYIIKVPLSDDPRTDGYYYDFGLENYYHGGLNSYIRRGRLIQVSVGYQTSCMHFVAGGPICNQGFHPAGSSPHSDWFIPARCGNLGNEVCPKSTPNTSDYVVRFRGIISDFSVNRGKTETTLEIICHDHSIFLSESINENWPTNIGYANAGRVSLPTGALPYSIDRLYARDSDRSHPNGRPKNGRCIIAYDAWPVVDAVRDIMANSGIDPSLLYGKKKTRDYAGNIIHTGYLIEDQIVASGVGLVLSRNTKYGVGNEFIREDKDQKDDKYLWGFGFGDKPIDMISKIADSHGYKIGFNNEGYAVFSTKNNYTIVDSNSNLWRGPTPTTYTDIRATQGNYFAPNPVRAVTVSGSKFDVVLVLTSGLSANLNRWDLIEDEILTRISPNELTYEIIPVPLVNPTQPIPWSSHSILWGVQQAGGRLFGELETASGYQSMFIFRPTKTVVVSGLTFNTAYDLIDIPFFGVFYKDDFKINMYMGVKSASNDTSFHSTYGNGYQVLTDYKPYTSTGMRNRGEETKEIQFDSPKTFTISGGYTYALKVVTSDIPANKPISIFGFCPNIVSKLKQVTLLTNTDAEPVRWGYFDPQVGTFSQANNDYFGRLIGKTVTPAVRLVGVADREGHIFVIKRSDNSVVYYKNITSKIKEEVTEGQALRFVYDGVSLRTGNNPCIVPIRSSDISIPTDTYGVRFPYGMYDIHVSGSSFSIDEIRIYNTDIEEPTAFFATGEYGNNIISMDIDDSSEDIRNDVIVVGNQLGPISDPKTSKIMNPNNPSNKYIFSRVIDVDSVYRLDSIYNIGRRKPFVIFEPNIMRQDHADALAISVADRFRFGRKTPRITSIGNPLVEIDDAVTIADIRYRTLGRFGTTQWVEGFSETIRSKSYEVQYDTTPYIPWPSIQVKPEPDINTFNGQPFVNIKLTDDSDDPRISGFSSSLNGSYDPYESEGSSSRVSSSGRSRLLKISFDQVIPGEVRIYIMPARTQPYWGTAFTFNTSDLSAVAFLKPNGTGFDDPEWISQDWGHYDLYWDGIDHTGWSHSTNALREDEGIDPTVSAKNIYAHDGRYIVKFEFKNYGTEDLADNVTVVSTENLPKAFNNPNLAPTTSTSYYTAFFDIQKGQVTYIDFQVSPSPIGNWPTRDPYKTTLESIEYNNMSQYIEFGPASNSNKGLKVAINTKNSSGSSISRLLAMRMSTSFWHWAAYVLSDAYSSTMLGQSRNLSYINSSPFEVYENKGSRYKIIEDLTYRPYNDIEFYFNPKSAEFSPIYFGTPVSWNQLAVPSYMDPSKQHQVGNATETWRTTFNDRSIITQQGSTIVSQGYLIEFDIWDRSGRRLGSSAGSQITWKPNDQIYTDGTSGKICTNFRLRAYYSPIGVSRSIFGDSSTIASGEYLSTFTPAPPIGGIVANPIDRNQLKYNALGHRYWKAYYTIKNNYNYRLAFPSSEYPPWGHPYSDSDVNPDVLLTFTDADWFFGRRGL